MKKVLISFTLFLGALFAFSSTVLAKSSITPTPTVSDLEAISEDKTASASVSIKKQEPSFNSYLDITKEKQEPVEHLKKILDEQKLGAVFPFNPIKYAIRASVNAGVSPNTIVLLLLLPVIASLIALGRHLVGVRGFGIFLPAALSVTFVALGPLLGIGLFLLIVALSTGTRFFLKKLKIKLQYLPRMALILWSVAVGVLGVLFLVPLDGGVLANISIFPVLILALLAEDFTKVQIGKSIRVAVNLTGETLILALASYLVLASKIAQSYALLYPERVLILTLLVDFLMGKYVGLRMMEIIRFRRLIEG